MLLIGCGLIIFNIVLRGFLLPAEYNLAGDPSNYPRIFFNPLNRTLYFAAEAGSRWIGSGLIAGSIVGFEGNLTNILLGGGITGLMGGLLLQRSLCSWLLKFIHGSKVLLKRLL